MRLPESNIKIESSGVINRTSFGIDNQDLGVILNILRTKIYKNPVLAVCREISCNARDAHVEVEEDFNNPTTSKTPIEIYLPNEIEPSLRIKDYGPGISPDRKDLFVKFGASTKRNDNKQIGGYGIGSKTPLAYSDSFSIETIQNKIKYVYHAYIDASQVGSCDLMHQCDTEEPNGTTIIVPIKSCDFENFADTVIQCTKHWVVKPKLFGGLDNRPIYPKFEELYRGTGWVLYSEGVTQPCALVDGIEYIIDRPSLSLNESQRSILEHGFCMEFGIGELCLTANRDHLHYDEQTKSKILARIDNICLEIHNLIIKSIENAANFHEACSLYRKIKKLLPGVIKGTKDLTWQGHRLMVTCNVTEIGQWAKVVSYTASGNEVYVDRSDDKIYFNDEEVLLVHNDKTRHMNKHIVLWLLNQHSTKKRIQVIYTLDEPSSADYNRILEHYGKDSAKCKVEYNTQLLDLLNPIKYSTINIPKTKNLPTVKNLTDRQKLEEGNINGYSLWREHSRRGNSLKHKPDQFPRDDGGVFVIFDYKTRTCTTEDKEIGPNSFDTLRNFLGEDILGLSPRRAEMVAGNPNWIPLKQAVLKKLEPYEQMASLDELKMLIKQSYFCYQYKCIWELDKHVGAFLNKESLLVQWINESTAHLSRVKLFKPTFPIYSWLGHELHEICSSRQDRDMFDLKDGLAQMCALVRRRYPLMEVQPYWGMPAKFAKSMVNYINLIDEHEADAHINAMVLQLTGNDDMDSVAQLQEVSIAN